MLLPGPDLHRAGALIGNLEIFATCLELPNVGNDQKKSHHLSAELLAGTLQYDCKSDPGYCITFIKKLDEGLRKQLLGQKLSYSAGLCI